MSDGDNVIPFPTRLRVKPQAAQAATTYRPDADLVEHDGHLYDWAALLSELTPQERQEIEATAPRGPQQAWDEVIRRWPWLAAELVADVGAVE